jgi:hypothetical protein
MGEERRKNKWGEGKREVEKEVEKEWEHILALKV